MPSASQGPFPATRYGELIARNIRAAMSRRGLSQEDLAERMRDLGYSAWIRQTVSNTVRGKRRLVAEELLGIAVATNVRIESLFLPSADDPQAVILPTGEPVRFPGEWLPRQTESQSAAPVVHWSGNTRIREQEDQ